LNKTYLLNEVEVLLACFINDFLESADFFLKPLHFKLHFISLLFLLVFDLFYTILKDLNLVFLVLRSGFLEELLLFELLYVHFSLL